MSTLRLRKEGKIGNILNLQIYDKLFEVIKTENTFYLLMKYAKGAKMCDYRKVDESEARTKF